jgi:hypothetical protein
MGWSGVRRDFSFAGWVRVLVGGEMPCHRGCAQEIRDQGIKQRKGWLKKRGGKQKEGWGLERIKIISAISQNPSTIRETRHATPMGYGVGGGWLIF